MKQHDASHLHVLGASEFIDDRAPLAGELYVEVLYSKKAHAKILKIDPSKAKALPDVVEVFFAKDFVHNRWGTIFQDQPLLAEEEVNYWGEAIALIAAKTRSAAREAKNLIHVEFKDLAPILSIEEAIKKNSFFSDPRRIERGRVEEAFKKATHVLEGSIKIAGADHFYLESQASIAYPLEDGQIEVHSSSQHPTETQHVVAHSLGMQTKDVVCVVKRMGGAFGGKESQAAPFAAYAALVAQRTKCPSRCVLNKDDDMIMTGKRNPFENTYKVAFDEAGKIQALDVKLFSDGGAYADLSTSIMERAMLHTDNAYFIPHMRVEGRVCRTHYHPHTAFRGFGGPKGVATIENIVEEISRFLKKDSLDIRKLNCYQVSSENITHYGQRIENNCLPALFEKLEKDSAYRERRKEIEISNRELFTSKGGRLLRGLSMTPVKFGISFTTRFLNQGNAYVIVNRDSSIQISTGATEMGQGVNARISQAVADELGVSRDLIRVMPTRTDKNANTSPTAASSGTDINAAAAVLAARKIKARLSHLAAQLLAIDPAFWPSKTAGLGTAAELNCDEIRISGDNPNEFSDPVSGVALFYDIKFKNNKVFFAFDEKKSIPLSVLVNEAYLNRVSLSDYAHYRFKDLHFNKLTGQGNAFLYFTQGVALSEVSVDLDTAELKVLRSDILMDLGKPILEDLDRGQIFGGFVQGMGWVTTEKLVYSKEGALLSHAPSTYKIPSVHDIPRKFIVKLFENSSNDKNLKGTKAVGEPPLLLSLSVWTAIQDALSYLPKYREKPLKLDLPATREKIFWSIHG